MIIWIKKMIVETVGISFNSNHPKARRVLLADF